MTRSKQTNEHFFLIIKFYIMKVTLDFINSNLVETKNNNLVQRFELVNDYFNENIGTIEITKYKNKFICFFSKQTNNKNINNFYTTINEDKDFLVNKLCNEFFNI